MSVFIENLSALWSGWTAALSWQVAALVAVVALASFCARRMPAGFRYMLWLVIVIKVLLPPSFAPVWGIGNWGIGPLWGEIEKSELISSQELSHAAAPEDSVNGDIPSGITFANEIVADPQASPTPTKAGNAEKTAVSVAKHSIDIRSVLFLVWLAGSAVFLLFVGWRYRKIMRMSRCARLVDEGPLRIELERLALNIGKRNAPDLLLSDQVKSPFLFGLVQPRIVLPAQLPQILSESEIRNVLLHELIHWKRRDLIVGWVQLLTQAVLWFHPLMWLANHRIRHERECACDEAAIQLADCQPKNYGESLLKVLLESKGSAPAAIGFLGIFEKNTKLQSRVEGIMNHRRPSMRTGALGWVGLIIFAMVFLPMAASQPQKRPHKSGSRYLVVPDDYQSIQTAIDNSTAPNTIYVRPGTYREKIVMKDGVSIIGQNPATTIIDAGDPLSAGEFWCVCVACDAPLVPWNWPWSISSFLPCGGCIRSRT